MTDTQKRLAEKLRIVLIPEGNAVIDQDGSGVCITDEEYYDAFEKVMRELVSTTDRLDRLSKAAELTLQAVAVRVEKHFPDTDDEDSCCSAASDLFQIVNEGREALRKELL